MKPWCVEVNGGPISLGDYANIIATSDNKVRFTVWSNREGEGHIQIGKYCLICAGVRISAATEITIGDNCMLANRVYVTDADWHDLYDRSMFVGQSSPVRIGNNVWLGDSTIVCKGVTIGDNSIVGAGAVVVKDIPPNVVAGGNPAVVLAPRPDYRPATTLGGISLTTTAPAPQTILLSPMVTPLQTMPLLVSEPDIVSDPDRG